MQAYNFCIYFGIRLTVGSIQDIALIINFAFAQIIPALNPLYEEFVINYMNDDINFFILVLSQLHIQYPLFKCEFMK